MFQKLSKFKAKSLLLQVAFGALPHDGAVSRVVKIVKSDVNYVVMA